MAVEVGRRAVGGAEGLESEASVVVGVGRVGRIGVRFVLGGILGIAAGATVLVKWLALLSPAAALAFPFPCPDHVLLPPFIFPNTPQPN